MGTVSDKVTRTSLWQAALFSRVALTLAVGLIAIISFAFLADEVTEGDTLPYDRAILLAINSTSSTTQDAFWQTVTQLGGVVAVLVIVVLTSLWLFKEGRKSKSLLLLCGVGGAALLNALLKLLFERERPDLWEQIVTEASYSFPSGHAMASASLAVSIVLIAWNTKWRVWVGIGAAMYVVLIGYSRLYLGVHYPTDILAGWTMSTAWVLLTASTIRYVFKRVSRSKQATDDKADDA